MLKRNTKKSMVSPNTDQVDYVIQINDDLFKVIRITPIGLLIKDLWAWEFWIVPNIRYKVIQEP